MTQSIYVVRSETGPVKIGLAGLPLVRLSSLQVGSPVPLHLHYAAEIDEELSPSLEARAHEILEEHRVAGEWFRVDPEEAVRAVMQAAKDLGVTLTLYEKPERKTRDAPIKEATIAVRLLTETRSALEQMAKDDFRTLSSLIEKLLTEAAKKNGYLK